jgi:hypothetical protein
MPSRSRSVPPPGRPPRPLEHPGRYPGRPRGPSLGRTHSRPFYRRLACVRSDLLRHGHQLDHLLTVSWPVSWLEIAQAPPPQQAEEQMSATPAGPADAGARRWTRSARTMEASDVVRTRQGAPADRGWSMTNGRLLTALVEVELSVVPSPLPCVRVGDRWLGVRPSGPEELFRPHDVRRLGTRGRGHPPL